MTLAELIEKRPLTVKVADAAKIMGISIPFLRAALMQGKFPFGIGVEMGQNEFYINTERFILYMTGADIGGKINA